MSPTRSEARSGPQAIGFIDVGTNSVRLMVVRLEPDRSWSTITLQKEPVRLGEGAFGAGNNRNGSQLLKMVAKQKK